MTRKDLLLEYKKGRSEIKQRLAEFKRNRRKGTKRLFAELCFCLCTPQSKAINCDKAVRRLEKGEVLFKGSSEKIAEYLKGLVRFHNNKARFITDARDKCLDIKNEINSLNDPKNMRQWLVKNVKGLGLKEASHFLRNIGLGDNLAIIDRHILTNLKKYGAIYKIPEGISAKQYLLLEQKMRRFSKEVGIPLAELDLLFWSSETGHIFK